MNDAAERLAFARGAAVALTWSDHRCDCGAGRWSALDANWVRCEVCELCIPLSEMADAVVEGRVRARNLTAVKLPVLPPAAPR